MMKRIGVFGGSFDPPHLGHISAARIFLENAELDKLYIIPSAIPPNKVISGNIGDAERAKLARLAFEGIDERISVSEYEISRGGINRTIDTLKYFIEKENAEYFLLLGSDMFCGFENWYGFEEIMRLCTLVCIPRNEDKAEIFSKKEHYENKYGAKALILSAEPYIISSSEIRREIGDKGFSENLSPKLNDHIEKNFLYGSEKALPERKKIIEYINLHLPEERIDHILSVEREAYRMAKSLCFNDEDSNNMRLCALCHDLTRNLSPDEHFQIIGNKLILSEEDRIITAGLHAISGSILASEKFGLPKAFSDAIRYHTTARENMTLFDKILWLSDFIEEEREHLACIRMRERYYFNLGQYPAEAALDISLFEALGESLAFLKRKEKRIHPLSFAAYEYMRKEVKKYGIT